MFARARRDRITMAEPAVVDFGTFSPFFTDLEQLPILPVDLPSLALPVCTLVFYYTVLLVTVSETSAMFAALKPAGEMRAHAQCVAL